MRKHGPWRSAVKLGLLLIAGAVSAPAPAAPGALLGAPIALPNAEEVAQAEVAQVADGRFVALWHINGVDGYEQLLARVYKADGTPATAAVTVYEFTGSTEYGGANDAAVAAYPGGFVVTWTVNPTGGQHMLSGQRFALDGSAKGTPTVFAQNPSACFSAPGLAINAAGAFVVSWRTSTGDGDGTNCFSGGSTVQMLAQSYNADGSAHSQPLLVYSGADNGGEDWEYGCIPETVCLIGGQIRHTRSGSAIAIDGQGDFVVAWTHGYAFGVCPLSLTCLGPAGADVLARRYHANGTPFGLLTFVDHTFDNYYWITDPAVAMAADGSWVISWRAGNNALKPQMTVYAQRYGTNGQPSGLRVTVGSAQEIDPIFHVPPSVAMADNGTFAIAWGDYTGGANAWDVLRARLYSAAGAPLSNAVDVAPLASWSPDPVVSMDAQGNFVVAYETGAGAAVQRLSGP